MILIHLVPPGSRWTQPGRKLGASVTVEVTMHRFIVSIALLTVDIVSIALLNIPRRPEAVADALLAEDAQLAAERDALAVIRAEMQAEEIGMQLTESYAMYPGAAVSGFYLAHPDSKYFVVGKIGDDQVLDMARRRGMDKADVERHLAPNLS